MKMDKSKINKPKYKDRKEEIRDFFNKVIKNYFLKEPYKTKWEEQKYGYKYKTFLIRGVIKRLKKQGDAEIFEFGDIKFTKADIWILNEILQNENMLKELGE